MRRITLIGILALACLGTLWLAFRQHGAPPATGAVILPPPEGRRANWFDDAEILRETEHDLEDPAGTRRTTLLRRAGRYPLVRVVETLATDPVTGTRTVVSDSAVIADHFMVTLRDGVTEDDLRSFNVVQGTRIRRKMYAPNMYLVEIPSPGAGDLERLVAAYNAETSLFAGAEPDHLVELFDTTPNDPSYTNGDLWGIDKIDCPKAWDTNTGGDVVVAVIDSGVDYDHFDLADNIWSNPNEVAGNSVDDDGNGFVDDVHGWDFGSNDSDPKDFLGHGTRVSGVIGAVGNNATGMVGTAWSVKIMAVKITDDAGAGSTSTGIECLNYVRTMRTNGVNVRVSNNSWGSSLFVAGLSNAVAGNRDSDILCVASAGNYNENADSLPRYPAAFPMDNVISVLATTSSDGRWYDSNYGATSVDLGAPGDDIYSTHLGDGYLQMDGTSYSAPFVSGAAALLADTVPSLPYHRIRQAILDGVDTVPVLSGLCVTGGRLNVFKAMQEALQPVELTVTGTPVTVGAATPAYGPHSFPPGSTVTAACPATVAQPPLSRYASEGWTGTGSTTSPGTSNAVSFVIAEDSVLDWQWELQHALVQTSSVPGIVQTSSWHNAGTTATTVTAEACVPNGGPDDCFAEWRMDGVRLPDDTNTAANPVSAVMTTSHVAEAVYLPETQDGDGDGMSDWWERFFFGTTNTASGEDRDGDLSPNGDEETAGTDPNNAGSVFEVESIAAANGDTNVVVAWSGISGRVYSVYYAETPTNGFDSWIVDPAFTNVPGAGASMSYTGSVNGTPRRAYHVGVSPSE